MLKKYSRVIPLYAAIITGIICADEVKKHDVVDADNRNALRNLFTDSFSNMRQLLQQNYTINQINLTDDLNVRFYNLSVTKLTKNRDTRSQLIVECVVNSQLKITIPVGYYELKGFFEATNDTKIHPFAVFINVNAKATEKADSPDYVAVEIFTSISKSEKPVDEIAATLEAQMTAIEVQIFHQLAAQIDLSYFTTAENYCFRSGSEAQNADQRYYLINQTHVFQVQSKNITVEWIKISDFNFNFTFKLDDLNKNIDYYYGSFDKYFTFSGYYADDTDPKNSTEHRAIFIGILCADDVKQHDVVDGDNRNALRNLFTDTFSNMRQLLRQNITINHINLKDDSNVKFHNLSVTKLPKSRHSRSQLIVECLVKNQLKIIIPLGYYELAGSFETTNDSKIHPFVIFKNIDANITLNLNSQKTVEHIDILIPKSEKPIHEIAATLNAQMSAIKAQILDQLFAQIKKDDLLSYFATAKNYCFHSHCDARHADQHYLINQTQHAIQVNQKNITVEWIKIHDFYFNFTFKLDDFNNEIDYYYGSFNADFTFKGYYTGEKDPKNSTEHRGKLKSAELGGIELESGDQGSKTAPDIYADPSNADLFVTRGVGAKLSDIIRDDLLSVIYRKYA